MNAYSLTEKGLFLSVLLDNLKIGCEETEHGHNVANTHENVDLGEPTSSLDHVYLGCAQRGKQTSKEVVDNYKSMFENQNLCWSF